MLETNTSPTVMLTVVDAEPTELLAQTVNTAPVTTCVGPPNGAVAGLKGQPIGRCRVDGPRRDAARRAVGGNGRRGV